MIKKNEEIRILQTSKDSLKAQFDKESTLASKLQKTLNSKESELSKSEFVSNLTTGGTAVGGILSSLFLGLWRKRAGDTVQYRNSIQQLVSNSKVNSSEIINTLISQGCKLIPERYAMHASMTSGEAAPQDSAFAKG